MSGPTRNLTWRELACKDGSPYPYEWRDNRAIQLAEIFEMIRYACGNRPIKVVSAYRSYLHNKSIGGAPKSQHLQGRALDLVPPYSYDIEEFYNVIKTLTKNTAIKGVGKYKNFVHVDIRPTSKVAYWFGKGMKDYGV